MAALDALSPVDHDVIMRHLRQKPAALPEAVVVLTNLSKGAAMLAGGGAAAQKLAAGAAMKLAIPPLPLARGAGLPTTSDSSGLPTAPKSLLSVCASTEDKGEVSLRVDLGGWIANAARCGWPFAFHRHSDKEAGSAWRIETRPVFEIATRKTEPVDLVVIGLGVDLSELGERFALMFDKGPTDGSKVDAK